MFLARMSDSSPAFSLHGIAHHAGSDHGQQRFDWLRRPFVFFDKMGFRVTGIDNNMRRDFFGPKGDTTANRQRVEAQCHHFTHTTLDIRDRAGVDRLFDENEFDLVIHAAAQPSHDLAAKRPFDDFAVNAVGTLNLLDACRRHRPEAIFIFMSTNKVYGDVPNHLALKELETRYDFADPKFANGISEDFSIDRSVHSLMGVSKISADVLAQEYGKYFGMKTGVFRGGCLTGPQHAGVELHGFLNYLVAVAASRRAVHGLRIQGEAGPRPDPQPRRDQRLLALRPKPPPGRGLQPRRGQDERRQSAGMREHDRNQDIAPPGADV